MGLLDDAIREHLDLKRRRGADPAEIERAEREALGPVHREPIAGEDGTDVSELSLAAESSDGPTADHQDVPAVPPPYGDRPSDQLAEDEEWDDYEDEDYEDDEEGPLPGHVEDRPDAAGQALPPERPVRSEPSHRPRLPEDDPEATQAHQIEPPAGAQGHPEHASEDPLQETPDFLQDTPDHDRLWFEQRPPKDFDFDE